ncbi:MAG: DUF2605 family protein [Cyanobium sp.]
MASSSDPAPGNLLDQLLQPLLTDYEETFARGLLLLDHCPEHVLPEARQQSLGERLREAQAALAAARALRAAAAPTPLALDMATITPWHELVVEVWSLSAAMRAAGVAMP